LPCTQAFHIYCFGVSKATPLTVTPAQGRRAFVTVQPFMPSGGVAAADALCQQEAAGAGLSGASSFLALLGTTTTTPISRFSLAGPTWVRLDGIPVADSPLAFAAAAWRTSLSVTPIGTYAALGAYTGNVPNQVGQATCADWTSTSSTLSGVTGASYASGSAGSFSGIFACSGQSLYCLEP
jgi:hypothetical protein